MGIVSLLVVAAIVALLAVINFKVFFKEQPSKIGISNYTSVVSDVKSQLKNISDNDPLAN